ncbi:tannase and feruloyl esterase [Hortaea werneckii]|nr:tannase and feruloyl esterase [Hortaea werneckii]KAI7080270.1 tannase and feruloyl esterase [Hortaea werneckii]KAI7227103.1 tannase and feruloyl esterase [Hortaea werneckii]KAI7305841.1 tannase and feruloyl esterase [Hortaea werneckii]KAI7391643.1 tannase and feruloyl esterase [Hortaea werneckii]
MHSELSILSLAGCATAFVLPHSATQCTTSSFDIPLTSFNATISSVAYQPANARNVSGAFNQKGFCEVNATIGYGTADTLDFTLWLPDWVNYEGRFMAVGNGGMAGSIDYVNMLKQFDTGLGVAVAGGNAGHLASQNNDGEGEPSVYLPYLHDPAQVEAWIHNAVSLFTPAAKALTAAYYRYQPTFSYYDGCSTGGAQGFALAQYHPELFDGIVAGSPGNWYSHLALSFLWNAQHTNTSASNITQHELNGITDAVLDACDMLDGVQDRLIENPLACNFDLASLACGNDTSNATFCLTATQLEAAKAIYAGPTRPDSGSQIYPGFSFGSEREWAMQVGELAEAFSIPLLQNLVYNDLNYSADSFDWESNVVDVDVKAGTHIDEISPDLSTFRSCGGKLLVTQGWADPFNAAIWPIQHLERVEAFFRGDVSDFFNLFMIPGGGHCGAAEHYPAVPATYHAMPELVRWVERGRKPEAMLSTDPPDGSERTRRLCPWPQTARYVAGENDNWTNYVCE